jgi:hypothetical protein
METGGSLDDEIPNAQLFIFEVVPNKLIEITAYLKTCHMSKGYTQK